MDDSFPSGNDAPPAHPRALRFLIIDDNPDGRFLVAKTLLRKFPKCAVLECQDAEVAFGIMENESVSLVVCHRTYEFDGISLIRELRARNATVPILVMSGIDRREPSLAAGANAFVLYEEWLMVGNHVSALLAGGSPSDSGSPTREPVPAQ